MPRKKHKKAKAKVPSSVGDIQLILYDIVIRKTFPKKKLLRFEIDIVNGDGEVMETLEGELTKNLTDAQIVTIEQFMDDVRAQVVADQEIP